MAKPPKQTTPGKPGKFSDLPVLTEMSVTHASLPVLTEILGNDALPPLNRGVPLSDAQCAQLAEQLAPQLDSLLREKLTIRLASAWLEAWTEVKAELPRLIRAELEQPGTRSEK